MCEEALRDDEVEIVLGPGYRHVEQPPLFLYFGRSTGTEVRGNASIDDVQDEYRLPFLAFGAPANPLELSAAFIFAALFVAISLASSWARTEFGQSGLFGLAAIVGFSDIDPFVLSVAAGGAGPLSAGAGAAAILTAASSNNLLKAAYAGAFAGGRAAAAPAAGLALLALGGIAAAWWIANSSGG